MGGDHARHRGYGDLHPVTPLGKALASLTAILALIMVALPACVIASAFSRKIHRRDFVVTWAMVARAPLFANLDAATVAEIMRYLRSQSYDPGDLVVRRGDPAHSMYFIASGEVEIAFTDRRVRLGAGHFFGEVAVLRRSERSATVRAVTRARLLVLDATDQRMLMAQNPEMARRVEEAALSKVAAERIGPQGDIAAEEVESRPGETPRQTL